MKLYVAECKQIFGNSCFSKFQKHNFGKIDAQIFRGHRSSTSKKKHQVQKNYFYSALLFAPLHENSTSREIFQPRCQKRAAFFRPPTCMLSIPSPEPTYFATPQSTAGTGPKPPKYLFLQCEIDVDRGATLRGIVG